jgi:hypothetical protein
MQKVELSEVLDLLIAENREEAETKLHEWFVAKSKGILEELMQEDDEALDDIESDQAEIETEEYYGDADLAEADDEVEGEGDDEIVADAGDEIEGDEVAGDLEDVGGEFGEEEMDVEDKVEDLEAQLASLKAEFDKLMGVEEVEHDMDMDADGDIGGDMDMDMDMGDEVKAEGMFEAEDKDDEDEEELKESDDDFEDLEESFELEKVADPGLSGEKEVGHGGKVAVHKDSPIPQKKTTDRVGGKAVEIKGKEHKGYEREAAPQVQDKPILKNQVRNAKADLENVKQPEGDKSALLNKGPAPDKGKSPIGGGAVDLRGDDFKRK